MIKTEGIGILGGTFDPIHCGHVKIAKSVQSNLGIRTIIFIPCATPPHRNQPIAKPQERLKMVELALAKDKKRLIVDDCEIKREGKSFTIETIRRIKERFPDPLSLNFILGSDAFLQLPSWKEWQSLLKLVNFIVIQRGQSQSEIEEEIISWPKEIKIFSKREFNPKKNSQIILLPFSGINESSTKIRNELKEKGIQPDGLPSEVYDYITRNCIYSNPIAFDRQ